jgi:hypothetical protein
MALGERTGADSGQTTEGICHVFRFFSFFFSPLSCVLLLIFFCSIAYLSTLPGSLTNWSYKCLVDVVFVHFDLCCRPKRPKEHLWPTSAIS